MIKKLNALKNQKGMTLVELLAVMVIVGIIAAISIPAIGNLMENSRKDAHISNAVSLQEAGRLFATANEAELTQYFAANTGKSITITFNRATGDNADLKTGTWQVSSAENTETTILETAFDGYVDNFLDPHTKNAYVKAVLEITKGSDNNFNYAVFLQGDKLKVAEQTTPKDATKLTRSDVTPNTN